MQRVPQIERLAWVIELRPSRLKPDLISHFNRMARFAPSEIYDLQKIT
jgi:hypothetical protein